MIRNFCDSCKQETKKLEKIDETDFKTIEVCSTCSREIGNAISSLKRTQALAYNKLLKKWLKPETKTVGRHKHIFPESPGWISKDRTTKTLHFTCTQEGCRKQKEEVSAL